MHASCRKIHGGQLDGLALAADTIAEGVAASAADARPHLLLLSGDQIYADENPTPVAARVRRIATDLVGVDETATFGALPPLGGRQGPGEAFGLSSSAMTDHLWGIGEYYAQYLLAWSDVLWPAALPTWAEVQPELDAASGFDEAGWNAMRDACGRFRAALPKVRRLLATVPSLMVLDDHEVTDDWNLDHAWATAVYASARASRIVANAVLAYVLFQHWGNVPDRFATAGSTEAAILAGATFAGGASPDTAAMRALLGVPAAAPPAPPTALRDIAPAGAMRYDVMLGAADGYPLRIVLLDERTVREFLAADRPAARISRAALALMLPPPAAGAEPATLVVASFTDLRDAHHRARHPAGQQPAAGGLRVHRLRVLVRRAGKPPGPHRAACGVRAHRGALWRRALRVHRAGHLCRRGRDRPPRAAHLERGEER